MIYAPLFMLLAFLIVLLLHLQVMRSIDRLDAAIKREAGGDPKKAAALWREAQRRIYQR